MVTTPIQWISERLSKDLRVFLMFLGVFFVIGITKLLLGYVPGVIFFFSLSFFFLAFFFPRIGLFALVALTVFFERFFTLEPFFFGKIAVKLYPLDLVLLGVYANMVVQFLSGKRVYFQKSVFVGMAGFFALATLFFLVGLFSFGGYEIFTAVSTWKNYVFYGLLAFAIPWYIQSESDIRQCAKVFLLSVAGAVIFLLIGVLRGEGLWTEYTPLSTTGVRLLAFPHAFYFALAWLVVLVANPLWIRTKMTRLGIIFLSVWGFGIIASLMRHIWISLFLTLCIGLLFFFGSDVRRGLYRLGVLGFGSLVVVLSGAIFLETLFSGHALGRAVDQGERIVLERIFSIGNTSDESISWRGTTWASAVQEIEKHPFIGTGYGKRVAVESGEYRDFVEVRNIHNSWLALLVQMGMLGFTVLAASVGLLGWLLFRLRPSTEFLSQARVVFLSLLVFQIGTSLAQPYLETNLMGIFFWITLGLSLALLGTKQNGSGVRESISQKVYAHS